MTVGSDLLEDGAIEAGAVSVAVDDRPEGLATIHQPGRAAALWRRQPPSRFQLWIDQLAPEALPRTREIVKPDAVAAAMTAVCDAHGTPDGAERAWLVDDVASLATRFAEMMDAPYLRLRLDVVTTNACRKFHIDSIVGRLICTYRGTGTQYGVSLDGAEPSRVFTVATGAPIVLRGTLWPESQPNGSWSGARLLHRSPPIAGTGETRLLLVLDPVHDPEEEDA